MCNADLLQSYKNTRQGQAQRTIPPWRFHFSLKSHFESPGRFMENVYL